MARRLPQRSTTISISPTDENRFAASKRGLVSLVQSAALDYVKHCIRMNALIPGITETALVRRVAHMMDAPDPVWETTAKASAERPHSDGTDGRS